MSIGSLDNINRLQRYVLGALCMLVVGCPSILGQQVPDTLSLSDLQFFQDQISGAQYLKALQVPEDSFVARDKALEKGLRLAEKSQDLEAIAILETEIALSCLRQNKVAAAFDWVNRSLSLDGALPSLSPIRQRVHLNIAGLYVKVEAQRLALEQFRVALEIDERRAPAATPRRYRHCSDIAICHQRIGEMDSAFAYYQRAIDITQAMHDYFWESSALNNLGMAYQQEGRFQEALDLFLQADTTLRHAKKVDAGFAVSIHDNLGHAKIDLGRYEDAVAEFQRNLQRLSTNDVPGLLKTKLGLAEAYIYNGSLPTAGQLLAECTALVNSSFGNLQRDFGLRLMRLQMAYFKARGDWQQVANYQSQVMHVQDSMHQKTQVMHVGALENLILDKTTAFQAALELSQSRNAALESRSQFQGLLYVSALVTVILICVVIVVALRRRADREKAGQIYERIQRDLAEVKLKNQQLENGQLNHELEMKKRDITDFALVHAQRKKVFEEVLENLKRLKRAPNQEAGLQELIISLKGKLDAEGAMNLEAQHVESVNHAFFDKLRRNHPTLSPAELELCSMIRLGHSVKDIAALRNIAPASVRIAKTRLKKRLELTQDQDLGEFLKMF